MRLHLGFYQGRWLFKRSKMNSPVAPDIGCKILFMMIERLWKMRDNLWMKIFPITSHLSKQFHWVYLHLALSPHYPPHSLGNIGSLMPLVVCPLRWIKWEVRCTEEWMKCMGSFAERFITFTRDWNAWSWHKSMAGTQMVGNISSLYENVSIGFRVQLQGPS